MAATISSSPRDHSSPLESLNTSEPQQARTLVEEYAKGELASDRTSKILFAFLDHLPPDGQSNVSHDVIGAWDGGLRELADHYVTNILVPSMFLSRLLIPLPPSNSAPFAYNLNSQSQRW